MKILRWALMTALLAAFVMLAVANWKTVSFHMPNGMDVLVPLPLLLAAAFVAGWLPTWLVHLGTKAQLTRRLAKASAGTKVPTEPRPSPLPSQAQPTIVPPAGA